MAAETTREEYTYRIENRVFIVTPVYKEKGEPLRDILLKLMRADRPATSLTLAVSRGIIFIG